MRNMDRWLGNGGMALIEALGARFETYGADGEGASYAEAAWEPTPLACNPQGTVQGGTYGVIMDAAMNFAINAGLDGKDRTRATLEMKIEMMRPSRSGDRLRVHGEVSRLAKQVAYAEAKVLDAEGRLISRATSTFLLHRAPDRADA